jgi:hemolysin activation/secretion protein
MIISIRDGGFKERQTIWSSVARHGLIVRCRMLFLMWLVCWSSMATWRLEAAQPDSAATSLTGAESPITRFDVRGYVVAGNVPLAAGTLDAILSRHTGTNIEVKEIVQAAADLQAEYQRQGHPAISVAVMPGQITDGIITLNVFQAVYPQIVVSGRRYLASGALAEAATNSPTVKVPSNESPVAAIVTNVPSSAPVVHVSTVPATPEELAAARAELLKEMAELAAREKDTRIHVVSTNTGPRFEVEKYLVLNNSVLSPETIAATLTNIDGAFGTNVSFDGIQTALAQLQATYRARGYVTVSVGLPQQKLTNATIKVQVTEGRLADIQVKGNNYFSSNNVMRALPSLHDGTILNGLIFQAELNRANANRDRQIYPVIGPGPDPGTSEITLRVKDQLPLHGKVEFNNESSPGTPDLRVNSSAVYDNLWQLEHSLGVQYGFSPEQFKLGNQWDFYDRPLVANYSGFYRMPLGSPEPVEDIIAKNRESFGYSEATHKFNLPPPSGQTELTLYASRSTIDTGVQTLLSSVIYNVPGVRQISRQDFQQDITINEDLGFRLNKSLPEINDVRSSLSGGLDFKTYSLTDYKTNTFNFTEITRKPDGSLNPPIVSSVISPVPVTARRLEYLPLALRYDGTLRGLFGVATFGLGVSGNAWYSGSSSNLQSITGSAKSTGHWISLDPNLTWNITVYTNWMLTITANGQWASEPVISTEQFGAGGVNSVRGYHEGEVFGDDGWHISVEQQTPSHVVGMVHGSVPLTVRGSVYMDYARTFLIDPQGRPGSVGLWGVGFGGVASLGPNWEARFLFSLPLLDAGTTVAGHPYFNFGLTAQF